MFDKVETRLRWLKSSLVLKYPRCSLKRFSAYADAEADPSQLRALASMWSVLLASGLAAVVGPPLCALDGACQSVVSRARWGAPPLPHGAASPASSLLSSCNTALVIGAGLLVGIPLAMAAVRSLEELWKGGVVALKGTCPSCGEEVYAFVKAEKSLQPQHRCECHVCEHPLAFHASLEPMPGSKLGQLWAHGRVYLVTRAADLAPHQMSR
eukprot:SM000214S06795  [mRNA]  locus=s214:202118:203409:- [translate_table: standard]